MSVQWRKRDWIGNGPLARSGVHLPNEGRGPRCLEDGREKARPIDGGAHGGDAQATSLQSPCYDEIVSPPAAVEGEGRQRKRVKGKEKASCLWRLASGL